MSNRIFIDLKFP